MMPKFMLDTNLSTQAVNSRTPDKRFIFTITTGRSGTNFLSELFALNLDNAVVHHEQLAYSDWGVNSPDISHLTTFNHVGNNSHVRAFWEQKFARLKALEVSYFAEMSHVLAKAGLVENLDLLQEAGEIHLIYLKRDIAETVISFISRAGFSNKATMWLWTLDPDYPNVILSAAPFRNLGQVGFALWYVLEMRVRAEYCRLLLAERTGVVFHEVDMKDVTRIMGAANLLANLGMDLLPEAIKMPGRTNVNTFPDLDESAKQHIRDVVKNCAFDAAALARGWYEQGYRLSEFCEVPY